MKTDAEIKTATTTEKLAAALTSLLFIADSQKGGPLCICDGMKPGYTCPYCRAREALAEVHN